MLLHLLDAGSLAFEGRDLIGAYDAIRAELGAYEPALLERAEIVALNKVDLLEDRGMLGRVEAELRRRGRQVLHTSGVTGEGVEELLRAALRALDAADAGAAAAEGRA